MELLVLISLLIGSILVAYLLRAKADDHPSAASKKDGSKSHDPGASSARPAPFDARYAKPAPKMVSISGRASIIDGDSIVIARTQIRLFGVDAPELQHPYGQKAKWALVRLCKGHKVRAEIVETDAYGRTVAKCYLEDGRDLSAEMVRQGLAIDWPKFSGGRYTHLEIRDARRKMWLADARQKGRMFLWERYEARRSK